MLHLLTVAAADCHHLLAVWNHVFRDERMDMLKVAWLSHTVIMAAIWESAPEFAARVADGEELGHVGGTAPISI